VHQAPSRTVVLALHEPVGLIGLVAPKARPLSGLLALAAPALAMGNRVVALPCAAWGLVAAELYAVLDTSDLPGGVLNLVTGPVDELADVLAAHAEVDALWWPDASAAQAARVEALSVSNLKRCWVADEGPLHDPRTLLAQAVQVKNVWVPYGV
jgi:aldehyde dehydrogenase (NAD+)